MDEAGKIKAYLNEKGLGIVEFARIASITPSALSEILAGNRKISLPIVKRAATAMRISLDYFCEDRFDWPPPPEGEPREVWTAAERRIIQIAREVSSGDPTLEVARCRLLKRPEPDDQDGGRGRTKPDTPEGPSYGDERKAAAEQNAGRRVRNANN